MLESIGILMSDPHQKSLNCTGAPGFPHRHVSHLIGFMNRRTKEVAVVDMRLMGVARVPPD